MLDRYTYADAIPSGTTKKVVWGSETSAGDSPSGHAPIQITPWQRAEIERGDAAFDQAKRARRAGRVDVEAMKILSPSSFEGAPDEEHEAIAGNLQKSAGALRFTAHSRAINDAPPEHNAKIQHIVQLASQRRGKGGVVFAHSRAAVEHTCKALEAAGHKVALITGSSSADDKAAARTAFDRGEVDIVLCSDAGATGANLQGRGEWLANLDLPLTQKTLEQRNARIDRLGQKKPIELHNLMSDAQHDKDNYQRLERKRALGALFQGEHEDLDDTGLGRHLVLAGLGRPAPEPDAQGGLF